VVVRSASGLGPCDSDVGTRRSPSPDMDPSLAGGRDGAVSHRLDDDGGAGRAAPRAGRCDTSDGGREGCSHPFLRRRFAPVARRSSARWPTNPEMLMVLVTTAAGEPAFQSSPFLWRLWGILRWRVSHPIPAVLSKPAPGTRIGRLSFLLQESFEVGLPFLRRSMRVPPPCLPRSWGIDIS
jgi:hypothetical protein